MTLKPLMTAVLALASTAAFAAGGSLGTPAPTASFSDTVNGSFTDIWTFTLTQPSYVAASLTNVSITVGSITTGGIVNFGASLDWMPLTWNMGTVTSVGVNVNTTLLTGSTLLPAGNYTLTATGVGVTGGSASYGGNIIVTPPVPEPASYALLLAGLGAVGFMAGRRRDA